MQQVSQGDGVTRVRRRAGERGTPVEPERLVQGEPAFVHQHADQRHREALRRRPRARARRHVEARCVALEHEIALVHDEQADGDLLG